MTIDLDKVASFIDEDGNTWYAKADDDYRPDRAAFVEEKFEAAYGTALSFNEIGELVSRSKGLRTWYAGIIASFILEVEVPQYYKEKISPTEYKTLMVDVASLNKINATESAELSAASAEYKAKTANIVNKRTAEKQKLTKNSLVRILTLTSEELPLKLQLVLNRYTPSSESDVRTKSLLSREMLIRYKLSLLEEVKAGADLEALIAEGMTKF